MKDANLSREKVVTDAKAIALLMHPTESYYLKPFMLKASSVSEAAELLNVSMNFLYYRVKRFLQVGILEKVNSKKRRGRAIQYYRASAESFFVPFSATDKESLEQLIANHDEHWQPNLRKGIANAYKASGLDEKYWGVRINTAADLMMFDINPYEQDKNQNQHPKGMFNGWDTRHHLSDEDVKALEHELYAVLNKYLQKRTGPRKVLHIAMANWSEEEGLC